ncbi:MAG: EF-hand domain-containing protein [bacterium]
MSDHSELRETFDHFDEDGNGHIDRKEFTHLLDALGAEMSAEEAAIGFEIIDSDGNGSIEFSEFLSWWTSL